MTDVVFPARRRTSGLVALLLVSGLARAEEAPKPEDAPTPAPAVALGLAKNLTLDLHGYYRLYKIVTDGSTEDYEVGLVANPANLETAADAADEEMRCMVADARSEFGP